jgi:unsaturated rhamnogalacturonyl hydrolase
MAGYIDQSESIQSAFGRNIGSVLETISNRYVADNPSQSFVFRLSSFNGIKRDGEYQYQFDFNQIYPDAEKEKFVYAWAKIWSDTSYSETFKVAPYSPVEVYVNGKSVYQSNFYEEKIHAAQELVKTDLVCGWNSVVIRFLKTALGFGGAFGTSFFKCKPWHFLAPTPERNGQEGFIFTEPMDLLSGIPDLSQKESGSPVTWYPVCRWNEVQLKMGQFKRIFGMYEGSFAYGWTQVFMKSGASCQITGESKGPLCIFIGGKKVAETKASEKFHAEFLPASGWSDVIVESVCNGDDWGYSLSFLQNGKACELANPCSLLGTEDAWIYGGPFQKRQEPLRLACLSSVFQTIAGEGYWRADLPGMSVRPFLETPNFANWNYPVGVTLYGLMKTGQMLHREDLINYVKRHIEFSTEYYEYAIWDKKAFGASGVDAQIVAVDSLDDCGSFASTMLEMAKSENLKGYRKIAEDTAEYIEEKQARLPDDSLYRYISALPEMKNTMWLDDLYMSVPFLSRYYRLTGDVRYLDDAVNQFILYREKMLIPGLKVMSHVYYTDLKIANGIPWGRGNGWVLFSLSELLQILPEDYSRREEMLKLFRELCEGYRSLQDAQGLWHQVLDDSESYPESSCTSMFICAFARGVQFGWLLESDKYRQAAVNGWNGLMRNSVDKHGNIYGICKGSGHSFTPRYYKYDLGWILNDTHGIGILLLAGVETQKMMGS